MSLKRICDICGSGTPHTLFIENGGTAAREHFHRYAARAAGRVWKGRE